LLALSAAILIASCGGEPELATSSSSAGAPGSQAAGIRPTVLPAAAPARLVCDEPAPDLGKVWQGAVVEHTFVLSCAGEEAAVVERLRPGCSCTVAETWVQNPAGERVPWSPGDAVPPGDSMHVRVSYDTSKSRGRLPRELTLYTANTPGNRLRLTLWAEVEPWLVVEPRELLLGRLSSTEARTELARVRGPAGERYLLSLARSPMAQALAVELSPLDPDAEGRASEWEVSVHVGPDASPGLLAEAIALQTDVLLDGGGRAGPLEGSAALQAAQISVVAQVSEPVSAEPPSVAFGLLERDTIVSRSVRIQSHDSQFELEEPYVYLRGEPLEHAAGVHLRTRAIAGGAAWEVELVLESLPEGFQGPFSGWIVAEVAHPLVFDLEIPFSGVLPPRPAGTPRASDG